MDRKEIERRAQELEEALYRMRRFKMPTQNDLDLTHAERFFLMTLASLNEGRPVMPSEAAKCLGVTMAAITHHINSLEEKGYVVRTSCPEDKRVVYVSLTEKGSEAVARMKEASRALIAGLVQHLGDAESAQLISLIRKATEYFRKVRNE